MSPPVVHVHTLCFNEEILLPYFLRHYLGFAAKIFIYDDNCSTDSTAEYLDDPRDERVVVEKFDANGEIRDDIYLELKNSRWKQSIGSADPIIWLSQTGRSSMRGDLRRALMKRFPYVILFRMLEKDALRITVVKHERRHPRFGLDRE